MTLTKRIGATNCEQIRCPKLDEVLKAVLSTYAIKEDGYLSWLQQFWLDTVSSLAAILECAEARDLMPEKAAFSVLCLIGNAHQQMAQKLLLKLNSSLKTMANEKKSFQSAAIMLFGEEFVKQATTTVDRLKAIRKCNKDEKKSFCLLPLKQPSRSWGWIQKQLWTTPPLQPGIELPSSTLQPPRSKQPRTKTLVMDISHGLHVVDCHKVTKFNYHTLSQNTILPSLKKGIPYSLKYWLCKTLANFKHTGIWRIKTLTKV